MKNKKQKAKKVKVYINGKTPQAKRKLVEAKVISERSTTLVVELPDGNKIVRKKKRDFPQEQKNVAETADKN